jgi:methylmalonyl-CoA mutase cobalamin-binding subunit
MTYYPYFRGKQFELITIRESASLMASAGFVPIVEPVRDALTGLDRALRAVCDAGGNAVVVVNPRYGHHREDGAQITALLQEQFRGASIAAGVLATSDMDADEVADCLHEHRHHRPFLIHAGFPSARVLARELQGRDSRVRGQAFIQNQASPLYRRQFELNGPRIIIGDGFSKQRNADYPPVETFSELHLIYSTMQMSGFGDFLTVGDSYSESGGPAYAVAIHLTFINPEEDDVMSIYHFVSDTNDTPTDPAGKFEQALSKLIEVLDTDESNLFETTAVEEFRELHRRGHFPGLGYVKKLSMRHHLETLARFLADAT